MIRTFGASGGRHDGHGRPTTRSDLPALHLHDRHTELGLGRRRPASACTARSCWPGVLDQKIWGLNRMGKAAFVVSGQGHEGAQVGSAWALRAGHDIVLPYYRDTRRGAHRSA